MKLTCVPLTLAEANEFVRRVHRHHKPTVGGKFAIGVADDAGEVRGVAIVGRPVSRMLDDGFTAEVNRVATDGAKNCCSMLYGAAWRAARAMGYRRMVTYTLPKEGGTTLRAAGWRLIGQAGGGQWGNAKRPRVTMHPELKLRWQVDEMPHAAVAGVVR